METLAVATMSVDEFLALPESDDGLPYELIDGVVVAMNPPVYRHEAVVMAIAHRLYDLLRDRPDLAILGATPAVCIPPDTVLLPDLLVHRRIPGNPYPDWRDVPTPLLVVEVLSPSTGARDRGIKLEHYLRAGVGELWLVDAEAGTVERWWAGRAEPVVERGDFEVDVGGLQGVVRWIIL